MKRTGVSGLKSHAPTNMPTTSNLSACLFIFFAAHHAKHGKKQKNRIKHKFSLANSANIVYTPGVLTRGYYRTGY